MNVSDVFSNTVQAFGLASNRGYLSSGATLTDNSADKGSLQAVFALVRKQLFDLVRETDSEQAAFHLKLLDAVVLNTKALKKRYQNKVGYLLCTLFSSEAKRTVEEASLLISESRAARHLLATLKTTENREIQVDELDDALNRFIGDNWKSNLDLLERATEHHSNLSLLRHAIVLWTTKRSISWLNQPFSEAFPLNQDELYRLLFHLDFNSLPLEELCKIHTCHLQITSEYAYSYWHHISRLLPLIGTALIRQQQDMTGTMMLRTAILMDYFRTAPELEEMRDDLFHLSFPQNLFTPEKLIALLKADEAAILNNALIQEQHPKVRLFAELVDSAHILRDYDDYALKAAVFVLRANRLKTFKTPQEASMIFRALLRFKDNTVRAFTRDEDIPTKYIWHLMKIYQWLLRANKLSCHAFDQSYPAIAGYFHSMEENSHSPLLPHSQKALWILSKYPQLHLKDFKELCVALKIESSFPRPPNTGKLKELLELSLEAEQVLLNESPYLYYLKRQLLENNNVSYMITNESPLILRIISGYRSTRRRHPVRSIEDLILLSAAHGQIDEQGIQGSLKRWLPLSMQNRSAIRNYSGRMDIDDEWLNQLEVDDHLTKIDLSDTAISHDALESFLQKYPLVKLKYRNSWGPGQKLLERNSGSYPLNIPGGVRNVHEALIRAVAIQDPTLDACEVDPFLEFCYTRQISQVADSVLASLFVKASLQGWIGIREYCFSRLISSMTPHNFLQRARLARAHPVLAPLRVYCARYSLAHCLNHGVHRGQFHESDYRELVAIAKRIHEYNLMPQISVFTPVNLGQLFPKNQKILCADGLSVNVNLEFLSLHSGLCERWFSFQKSSTSQLQLQGLESSGVLSISALTLTRIDYFLRFNQLPVMLNDKELIQLCCAAQYLEVPALKFALIAQIRSKEYDHEALLGPLLRELMSLLLEVMTPDSPEKWQELKALAHQYELDLEY